MIADLPHDRVYDAFLFDMDGTLLTSIPVVERAWTAWAARVGAPAGDVLHYMHGRRAIDTIRRFAPPKADIAAEVAWLDAREMGDVDGVAAIPGAADLLSALPPTRWAVVTSANRALALLRIRAAGLPLPEVLIPSDDLHRGKPDPEGYLRAAELLGRRIGHCLVFEDTATGLAAGRAAGADVVRIVGTPGAEDAEALAAITSYEDLRVAAGRDGLSLGFSGAPAVRMPK